MSRTHVTFCFHDNDFMQATHHALATMMEQWPKVLCEGNEEDIKEMVIRLMIGFTMARHWEFGGSYRQESLASESARLYEYFKKGSSVSFAKDDATALQNGEWCSIDLNRGTVWSH
jgi:hypothetical protein